MLVFFGSRKCKGLGRRAKQTAGKSMSPLVNLLPTSKTAMDLNEDLVFHTLFQNSEAICDSILTSAVRYDWLEGRAKTEQ